MTSIYPVILVDACTPGTDWQDVDFRELSAGFETVLKSSNTVPVLRKPFYRRIAF